jgi:hypothetical protein
MTGIELQKRRTKWIKRFYRIFRKVLKEQLNPVLEYLSHGKSPEEVADAIPILITEEPIKQTYIELYKKVGMDFREIQIKQMDDDLWTQELEKWCLMICGERITEVTAYSRQLINDYVHLYVNQGIEDGLSIGQIAERIRKKLPLEYGKTAAYRAQRIAQTEVISSSNFASLKSAEDSGLNMVKKWSTRPYGMAKNERHALLAQDLESQSPRLDEPFIVDGEELQYPGDPAGSPGNVINCFCTMYYEQI